MSRMLCCQHNYRSFSVVDIFAFSCYILSQIENNDPRFSKKIMHYRDLEKLMDALGFGFARASTSTFSDVLKRELFIYLFIYFLLFFSYS